MKEKLIALRGHKVWVFVKHANVNIIGTLGGGDLPGQPWAVTVPMGGILPAASVAFHLDDVVKFEDPHHGCEFACLHVVPGGPKPTAPYEIAEYLRYIATLVADLRESGMEATADDFEKCADIIKHLAS